MSSGGTERICQKAASPDSPRMRSCHALASVRPSTCSGMRTNAGQESSRPRCPCSAPSAARRSSVRRRPARRGGAGGSPACAGGSAGQHGAHPAQCARRSGRAGAGAARGGPDRVIRSAHRGPTAAGSPAAGRGGAGRRRPRRGGRRRGRSAGALGLRHAVDDRLGVVAGPEVLPLDLRTRAPGP